MKIYKALSSIQVVIMAGGKGTRFWPLSRAAKAKQFLEIMGDESLLKQTINRLSQLVPKTQIWVVGNLEQSQYLKANTTDLPPDQVLFEPQGKNTAPCIGWAALEISKKAPDSIMAVIPADQYIEKEEKFIAILKQAADFVAKRNALVTLGIKPTHPHTGYGYIEVENLNEPVVKVANFKEKPDVKTAEQYLATKKYFWNSGMFIWKAETILGLIKRFLPQVSEQLENIAKLDKKDGNYQEKLAKFYSQMPSISIDYGVMEKAIDQTYLIPSDFVWDDIGNWSSLEKYWDKDDAQNANQAQVLAINSHQNIVYSKKRLVSLVDVDNLIIVDSDDALLILPKTSDQKIRDIYNALPPEYK